MEIEQFLQSPNSIAEHVARQSKERQAQLFQKKPSEEKPFVVQNPRPSYAQETTPPNIIIVKQSGRGGVRHFSRSNKFNSKPSFNYNQRRKIENVEDKENQHSQRKVTFNQSPNQNNFS
jgi:hypothetical protein